MRVFLDTNILLDVLLNRPDFVTESEAAILRCEGVGAEMFVAWHGLATAYYLLRRGRTEVDLLPPHTPSPARLKPGMASPSAA